ncbi:MAG TPA: molybdopterin converting factor subunit 1 [Xanthomonadaceae bacterium]|nr:molybdopterin converting factor subunit 1 [Xanthomonadaceae bacterium]
MRVELLYFAQLREQAGREREPVDTDAATLAELYAEIAARHGFDLPRERLRVAVGDAFCDWSQPLCAGDEVALIPPVSGG